jgi:hypothetical protein
MNYTKFLNFIFLALNRSWITVTIRTLFIEFYNFIGNNIVKMIVVSVV